MMTGRRTLPRKISAAVLANLRESLVPLVYTTIAPGFYLVYLHKDDYAAIESIVPLLRQEIGRALAEATGRIARPAWWEGVLRPARETLPPVDTAVAATIEILPDPDDVVPPGEVAVHSELRVAGGGDFAGPPTVRVTATTTIVSGGIDRREIAVPQMSSDGALAWLTVDDMEGPRRQPLVDNPTLIGRGGLGCYVHVRLRTDGQVSKEHCRIRHDEQSGTFFIKDLSRNGTTVNGVPLPAGVEFLSTGKRELEGGEMPLPNGARIGLAGVLFLEFTQSQS
jgi:FHA domain